MSNHLHLVLRTRPDLVQNWSDEEIGLRWLSLCPPRDPKTGKRAEPTEYDPLKSRAGRRAPRAAGKPIVVHGLPERADRAAGESRGQVHGAFLGGPVQTPARRSRVDRAARASNQGLLPITFHAYRSLLDWTGRQIRAESRETIPAELAPVLEKLSLKGDGWLDTVQRFGRLFKQMVGRPDALKALAERMGRAWFQGQRAAAVAFL